MTSAAGVGAAPLYWPAARAFAMPARWRSKAASLANRQTSRIGSPLNGERRSLRKISEERICVAGKERRQRGERPPQDHSRGADTDPNKVDHLGFLNERGKPYNPRSIKAMLEE